MRAVVGGGPAGLAAAYRLTQLGAGPVLLAERAEALGGLAAGFRQGLYTLDYGPHRLHPETDPAVMADLRALLGGELRYRPRRGLIHLDGRYVPYPLGLRSLGTLGLPLAARLALGLARRPRGRQPASYADVVRARLGEPMYRLFYEPYARKVWGVPAEGIAADQADLRVNQRGPADLVRALLGHAGPTGYYYPAGGFGRIPAAYAGALAAAGVCLRTAVEVRAVRWSAGRVHALTLQDRAGAATVVEVDDLCWSAPPAALLQALDPAPPAEVMAAAQALRHRALVLCYVVLDVDRVGTADTYYFPSERFPFNRVIEQKHFSASLVPAGVTVLGMDIPCAAGDALYSASDARLRDLVEPALGAAGLLPGRVVDVFSRRLAAAYPVYDLKYRAALDVVESFLHTIGNLWLIGRQGLFLHNNTHHSLVMGYRAAEAMAGDRDRAAWRRAVAGFRGLRVAD